jgi:hypothetical protein
MGNKKLVQLILRSRKRVLCVLTRTNFGPNDGGHYKYEDNKLYQTNESNNYYAFFLPLYFLASSMIVLVSFLWQGHVGFNLWDEGFLWYGVQRVIEGEVPIRDFMAYEPGRYYSSAALMNLFGDSGIISLRITLAIFQAIGLWVGLLVIGGSMHKKDYLFLIYSTFTLAMWMYPCHKMYDITISIVTVATLVYLIKKPTKQRYLITGILVGLIALFGKNHGAYVAFGSILTIIYLSLGTHYKIILSNLTLFTLGGVVGSLPLLIAFILVPGFLEAFWQSFVVLFALKATNLALPVPWPWLVHIDLIHMVMTLRNILIGFLFVAIAVYGVIALIYIFYKSSKNVKASPIFFATAVMSIPYAHYAFSRADLDHLALGIFPFLIGTLAIFARGSRKQRIFSSIFMISISLLIMLPVQPGWQMARDENWVVAEIDTDKLKINPGTANQIALIKSLDKEFPSKTGQYLAVPFWPGAYAILKRKSPIWEIYALFPRSQAFQEAEIAQIKEASPGFAVILDLPLDGRDDLRFQNTHPLINKYIIDNFEPVVGKVDDPSIKIYKNPYP